MMTAQEITNLRTGDHVTITKTYGATTYRVLEQPRINSGYVALKVKPLDSDSVAWTRWEFRLGTDHRNVSRVIEPESSVLYQLGSCWVAAAHKGQHTVYREGATHATADSSYPATTDGLTIAKARVNYLASKGK